MLLVPSQPTLRRSAVLGLHCPLAAQTTDSPAYSHTHHNGSPGVDPHRKAFAARDTEGTLRLLQEALQPNPRLAETWYEEGRLNAKAAPRVLQTNDLQAAAVVEGLEAEKEWLRLLGCRRDYCVDPRRAGAGARRAAGGAANVDEVLADRESLLYALRVRTY